VETTWSGVEIPRYGKVVTAKDYGRQRIVLERFAEMARFNYGSTVIVLLPPGVADFAPHLDAEHAVQLGQALATLR
jgi:phosphatidylserine decarboxylase